MPVEKYIITKEDLNYSVISNQIAQTLPDAEALGLYIYLLSLPPNWEFYKTVLRKHFNWGRDRLEKKLAILRSHNLVEASPTRNEKGQFVEWNLLVKNGRDYTPIPNTENPVSGELSTGLYKNSTKNTETQNTENPVSGELSTGLYKNSTQNTEKPAAGKPVTGFSTPIKEIQTKYKTKEKSFYKPDQKKSKSDWREENAKRHEWADSKNQMAREAKCIEEHEVIKRTPMPEGLRSLIKNLKVFHGGANHDRATHNRGM